MLFVYIYTLNNITCKSHAFTNRDDFVKVANLDLRTAFNVKCDGSQKKRVSGEIWGISHRSLLNSEIEKF